jgi:predicted hydrolase (HD superfamily)
VSREDILEGAEDLGLEVDEIIELVLGALVGISDDLGL